MINPKLREFQSKIAVDQRWTERALLAIFKKQTEQEKRVERAVEFNGVGFTGPDSRLLSSFAKWLLSGKDHHLSPKQLRIAQRRMPKYAGQLCDIAEVPRTVRKRDLIRQAS